MVAHVVRCGAIWRERETVCLRTVLDNGVPGHVQGLSSAVVDLKFRALSVGAVVSALTTAPTDNAPLFSLGLWGVGGVGRRRQLRATRDQRTLSRGEMARREGVSGAGGRRGGGSEKERRGRRGLTLLTGGGRACYLSSRLGRLQRLQSFETFTYMYIHTYSMCAHD
jgi:hypothetical protein